MSHPTARGAAVGLLNQVMGSGRLLSELDDRLASLPQADRARALRLTNQTLRGLERADRLLSRSLQKKPPLAVMNTLRLGTVELCMGGDAHGIINELVTLIAADRRYSKFKSLVNAVLRTIADGGGRPWPDLRVPQMPGWLRTPLIAAWGKGVVMNMERAHFDGPSVDITVKSAPEDWAERLKGRILPTGTVRLDAPGQISALPGYIEGEWWVQDAAAAIAARALAPKPGERVLDLCAAPGGKTLQLAAMGAKVTAVDISASRIERLHENLNRTGLTADCIVCDALGYSDGMYDAILLDAPCSATGTIRRHPDLPFAKRNMALEPLLTLQSRLLDHALTLLSPGGRLVFCTCSLLPSEGEHQIVALLRRNAQVRVDADAFDLPGIDPAWRSAEGGLRLRPDFWPGDGGMDGFYMACLHLP